MTDISAKAKPNAAQSASPSYRLAVLDPDFLLGPSMRGVRFLLEFANPSYSPVSAWAGPFELIWLLAWAFIRR
jgi:hypothetical protein